MSDWFWIVTTFRLGTILKQGAESLGVGKLGAYPAELEIVFQFTLSKA
jgi:hypothetical protein